MAERYTAEQLRTIRAIKRIGRKRGVPTKHILAALATGKVEFNFQNKGYGDADSQNWRQERAQGYADDWAKSGGPLNLRASVNRFYDEAAQLDRGQSAGALAADVQRPREDLRGRYAEEMGVAKRLLGTPTGGGRYELSGRIGKIRPGKRPKLVPGGTSVNKRGALLAALLDPDKGQSLLDRYREQVNTGNFTTTTAARVESGKAPKYFPGKKITVRGGKQITNAPDKIAELFLNVPGGVNIDEGKRVGQGFVSGHQDHAHLASRNRKFLKRAASLADRMGLAVREFEPYDRVDPVHTSGSFHYRDQAMDVSGDPKKMVKFSRRVARGRL